MKPYMLILPVALSFLGYTFVLVCCSKKYDFNKETFILLNVEYKCSFLHSVGYYRQVWIIAYKI